MCVCIYIYVYMCIYIYIYIYNITYKIDNQLGPIVKHRELYSILLTTYIGKEYKRDYIYRYK